MVGSVNDPPGWDHIDNAAATVKPVGGVVNINVNEIQNSGTFEAALKIPEGDLVLATQQGRSYLVSRGTTTGASRRAIASYKNLS